MAERRRRNHDAPVDPSDPIAPHIDWDYQGTPDLMMGTGANRWEKALVWLVSALAPALLYLAVWRVIGAEWGVWQWLFAVFFAADIAGGVVANALNTAKRFYHAPPGKADGLIGRIVKRPGVFVAGHIHPFVVAALFTGWELWVGALIYGYVLAASLTLHGVPLYLQRPAAFALITIGIAGSFALPPLPGWEWFVPLLLIKLLYGHGVREEPYRPAGHA